MAVSIHTPARGVTLDNVVIGSTRDRFNPHPRTGGDCPGTECVAGCG